GRPLHPRALPRRARADPRDRGRGRPRPLGRCAVRARLPRRLGLPPRLRGRGDASAALARLRRIRPLRVWPPTPRHGAAEGARDGHERRTRLDGLGTPLARVPGPRRVPGHDPRRRAASLSTGEAGYTARREPAVPRVEARPLRAFLLPPHAPWAARRLRAPRGRGPRAHAYLPPAPCHQ